MKTKLYTIFTGLLMAACITSFGQEIVSEFDLQNGKLFSNTDIMACSDGTLLTGIAYYSSDYYENGLLVCKTTPEGQWVDSVAFDYGTLFSINGATDSFVIASFNWEDADSTETQNTEKNIEELRKYIGDEGGLYDAVQTLMKRVHK